MRHAGRADIVIRGMEYEHTLGVPGTHRGVTLGYEPMRMQETFDAMVPGRALEVCEFSLAVTRRTQRLPRPAGAKVETTDADFERLASDALLAVSSRDARLPSKERRLRSVLPDPEREERAYYERTRIFPIHRCIIVRNDVLARFRGLVDVLCSVYESAKQQAYQRRLGARALEQRALGSHARSFRRRRAAVRLDAGESFYRRTPRREPARARFHPGDSRGGPPLRHWKP